MRKGNLFFLILFVSIFAFSLYALEKQGTPLVKKESCCKEGHPEAKPRDLSSPLPLTTTPAKKPAKLQAKGEKDVSSKEEETPKAPTKKLPPAGSQPGKVPSSDVKLEKESEKKGVSSDEEEDEGEEEFEEYDDDESGPEDDEDADFSGY
ncbi:MAG: hypothetical protein AAB309_03790 [Deltaproteobacteria bacterium]